MPPSLEQGGPEHQETDIAKLALNVTLIGIVITDVGRAWHAFQRRRTESLAASPMNGRWREADLAASQLDQSPGVDQSDPSES